VVTDHGEFPYHILVLATGSETNFFGMKDLEREAMQLKSIGQALDIRSDWFLLTVTTSIGTTQSTMYSLLERDGQVVRARRRTFDAN